MADLEARVAALETEVRKLNDELAIRRIIARYGPLVDSTSNDPVRLRKVEEYFGEEGIYDLGGPGGGVNGPNFTPILLGPVHQGLVAAGSTHVMAMPYVLVSGDRATALGYSHVFQNNHDGSFKVYRASANYWEFSRVGGVWKIVRRTTRLMDGAEEPRQLLFHVDDQEIADVEGSASEI